MANFQATMRQPPAGKTDSDTLNKQKISPLTIINLRGNTTDEAFMTAVTSALPCPLPATPNTSAQADNITLLWLGPDEWLVRAPEAKGASLIASLRQTSAGLTVAITDVSDYYTVIRIGGAIAREALAAGCPLDLHTMAVGDCAQSYYAKAAILLHQTDDAPTFELQVRRSYADYLWAYLKMAAAQYK